MKIESWPIDKLIPYENNPRKNDDAVEYVANSIREFGFKSPIIVDGDGVVICGHTRLKAALSLGLQQVPVIVADDLTDEQVKAYRLADNKTGEKAWWDFAKLDLELSEIDWLDINMEDFGFSINGSMIDALDDEEEQVTMKDMLDTFAVTFNFPKSSKQAFEDYIRESGKDTLTQVILSEVGA